MDEDQQDQNLCLENSLHGVDINTLVDELLGNNDVSDEHQVSCMDRKEQWALRLLRKWCIENSNSIEALLTENKDGSPFIKDPCSNPEQLLLKGSLSLVDGLLSSFLVGARQKKQGKQYSADSLKQVIMAIQRFLRHNNRHVSLLTDPQFSSLQASIALEAVDRLNVNDLNIIKPIPNEVLPISDTFIDSLWSNNSLGFADPAVLIDTLIFYMGLKFGLTSGHSLRNINLQKNISIAQTSETTISSYSSVINTGLSPRRPFQVNVQDALEDETSLGYILRTYLSYRPEGASYEGPLFLQPSSKVDSFTWYSPTPMGKDTLSKALQRICRRAGLDATSINGSQLKLNAAINLARSGYPANIIRHLTGLKTVHYEGYVSKINVQPNKHSPKRSIPDTECSFSAPEPKLLKISGDEVMNNMALVPQMSAATPSTVLPVPINTLKLLGECLPQKIRVTSVIDGVFLGGNSETSYSHIPSWLRQDPLPKSTLRSVEFGFDPYNGFVADMLNALCDKIGTEFTFQVTSDNRYGMEQNGRWNGVVGQVQRGEADLGGAALTVTSLRQEAVDFCYPFFTSNLCLLYRKNPQTCHGLPFLSLRDALDSDYVLCAYIGGVYHTVSLQKTELMKKLMKAISTSGRVYNSLAEAINAVEQEDKLVLLINQEHAELIVRMQQNKFGMIQTNALSRHYAFATPKGSPLCSMLSRHVVELMEEGKVEELFHKWWHKRTTSS